MITWIVLRMFRCFIKMLTCLDMLWSEKSHHSQFGTICAILSLQVLLFLLSLQYHVKLTTLRSKDPKNALLSSTQSGSPQPKREFNGGEKGEKPQLEKKGSVDTIKSDPHQHSSATNFECQAPKFHIRQDLGDFFLQDLVIIDIIRD